MLNIFYNFSFFQASGFLNLQIIVCLPHRDYTFQTRSSILSSHTKFQKFGEKSLQFFLVLLFSFSPAKFPTSLLVILNRGEAVLKDLKLSDVR